MPCTQRLMGIVNKNHTLEDDAIDALVSDFENSADFRWVYRNKFDNNLLKAWITDGTTDDKLLGYKRLVSYPYKPIAFSQGDYLYFDYYHVDDLLKEKSYDKWSPWLIYALDYQNYYNVNAKLYPCNEQVRWMNKDKTIISHPCYMEDSMKYTTINFGQQGFAEPNADVVLFVQDNEDTRTMYINQRFIFNKRAYTIVQLNPEINNKVIKFFLNKVTEQPNDDFENNIAWNGDEVKDPVIPSGETNIFLPNINTILLNKTVEFVVYYYKNGIKQSDEFTIKLNNVDSTCYELNIIDGNNFSIKNIKQFRNNPLSIECTNDTTQKVLIKEVWLGGVF